MTHEERISQLEANYEQQERLLKSAMDIIAQIEGRQEVSELYYYASKVRKRSVEEILESVCIDHFGITKADFHSTMNDSELKKGGNPGKQSTKRKNIIVAQQWFISIMANVLHRSSWSMQVNYPSFQSLKIIRHRPVFMAAMNNPKTDEDHKNRAILLSIIDKTRELMRQEGIFDDAMDV